MKKIIFIVLLMSTLFVVGHVEAATSGWSVIDVYNTDNNTIDFQSSDALLGVFSIDESYGESTLIPYPSHDGFAVVNENLNFFDKIVYKDTFASGAWSLSFFVANDTPYTWSDYHFEFWNDTFTDRLTDVQLDSWGDQIFNNDNWDNVNSVLTFWAPEEQGNIAPNNANIYTLTFNDVSTLDQSFGIRQIATTAPEPISSILFLIGGATLGFRRLRMRVS